MKPMFILPPHPGQKQRIRREDLNKYEAMGTWIAQRKFNGTHTVIWIGGDEVALWDRRGIPLTLYKLTDGMKSCLLGLNRENKEMVLVGELLHTKAKSKITMEQSARDTIVLFDVLYAGEHLTQINQVERLDYLAHICHNPTKPEPGNFPAATPRALVVADVGDSHLWMAETFKDDFCYHFDEMIETDKYKNDKYPEIEGLMLRVRESHLRAGHKGDVDWLLRCRKFKDKVYTF